MRLGAITSFGEASEVLAELLRVHVSEATVRRLTETAGQKLVEQESAEAERISKGLLQPRGYGGRLQQVSVDGAMVPLVHGEWAEVKTVAIGQVDVAADKGIAITFQVLPLHCVRRQARVQGRERRRVEDQAWMRRHRLRRHTRRDREQQQEPECAGNGHVGLPSQT